MKRKEFIKKGILGTAAIGATGSINSCTSDTALTIDVPAINFNKTFEWRMTTVWGKNFPVFGESANLIAKWISEMSNGRLNIKVYGNGELVPGYETFDAVSMGVTEMGAGCSYYWQGKEPAAVFFATIPFGMNAQQVLSWLIGGDQDGMKLWKEVYAPFDLIPFIGGNTGVQMGGWFNKEINSMEDLKGLKMRIPGLAGKALEKAGGAAVNVAAGEIFTNLERGVIDATEWVGPYHDYKLGLHKAAKYYYAPGWHEPGTQLEFIINNKAWQKLPTDLREIVHAATHKVQTWMLAEFDAQNGLYLKKLLEEEGVVLKEFPDEVLRSLKQYSKEAVSELVGADPLAGKVYDSYQKFMNRNKAWSRITEKAYYNKILDV